MSSPSTPQHAPPLPHHPSLTAIRRVHTLPTRLIDPTKTPPQVNHTADAIETLLNLDFAKVVAFDVAAPSSRPSSSAGHTTSSNNDGSPWATPSERTLAAGPLRIYRVPNTGVSFLNSGSFLKPILQRSQCWSVDDDTKFVLRVREGSYYRIEVPSSTQEEKRQVEELKQTLDKLCRYEKTPCPFKKGYFEIEERPPTPVRRPSLVTKEKAKKWRLNKVWEPEDADRRAEFQERNRRASEQLQSITLRTTKRPEAPLRVGTEPIFTLPRTPPRRIQSFAVEQRSSLSLAIDQKSETTDSEHSSAEQSESLSIQKSCLSNSESSDSDRPKTKLGLELLLPDQTEAQIVSPELSDSRHESLEDTLLSPEPLAHTQPAEKQADELITGCAPETEPMADVDTASIISSHDSFYSVEDVDDTRDIQPIIFKLPLLRTPLHSRDSSIVTTIPDTPRAILIPPMMSQEPTTPTLTADSSGSDHTTGESSVVTPPQTLRQRRPMTRLHIQDEEPGHLSRRLSVLSPTAFAGSPISKAVIQKTYAMLIGPPTHIVTLMLSIAAQILNRLPGRQRQRIPGAWYTSDDDGDSDVDWDEADTEDDYGYPLQRIRRFEDAKEVPSSAASSIAAGTDGRENENWEID